MVNPFALFDLVKPPLLKEWDNHPKEKLAIIPFGIEIRSQLQVRNLCNLIFTTMAEITQAERLGLSALRPNKKANSISCHLMTFLAYNLMENQCKILQEHSIWASADLTFQVAPIEPCCPNYLFTLMDFTTMDEDEIHCMVLYSASGRMMSPKSSSHPSHRPWRWMTKQQESPPSCSQRYKPSSTPCKSP